jgi:radical SAM protein with 4Fe4S-binding SPASM domain
MAHKPITSLLAKSFLPATAVLEMTFACDHACIYCSCPWEAPLSSYGREKELTVQEWKELISQLCQLGISNFAFTGGEALLKPGILDIIAHAASQKVDFVETVGEELVTTSITPKLFLLSNGKNISNVILDFCKRHDVHLSLSLPGLATYARHVGNQTSSPERILYWLEQANLKGVATTANITVTKINLYELYETMANALIAGANNILLNRFLYGGRGINNHQDLSLSREQIVRMIDIAEDVLSASERYGSIGTEIPLCIVPDMKKYKYLKIGTRCSAAKDFFTIGPDGYIRTCNHSPVKLLPVSRISELSEHPYWKRFVFADYLPDMCQGCISSTICDGGCREAAHILHQEINQNDPVFS